MEATLIPLSARPSSTILSKIDRLCLSARSLEEIVSRWVNPRRNLIIGLNREMPEPCLALSFLHTGETIAVAHFSLDYVRKTYPRITALNERVLKFNDQEGYRPDEAWFDARNERLSVYTDEELDINVAPPESLVELLLSYALSSAGFAEISMAPNKSRNPNLDLLHSSLVFLGLAEDQGWYELIGIWKTALLDYVESRTSLPH